MNSPIRLRRLELPPITLHYSPGYDAHARAVGALVADAYQWLSEWLEAEMEFTVSVLRRENWEVMRRVPYGYPHSNVSRMTVYVPARYPPRLVSRVQALVETAPGALQREVRGDFPSLEEAIFHFLDMVAVHELGHLFISRLQLEPGAKWLHEFIADLFATAYFAEAAPDLLPLWLAWARVQTAQSVAHRSLAAYEAPDVVLDFANSNYYQGQFNLWAHDVWQREGAAVAARLIAEFSHRSDVLKTRLERVIGEVGWL